jgi:hypothetical protein
MFDRICQTVLGIGVGKLPSTALTRGLGKPPTAPLNEATA